jgi:hypothetical protein
MDAFYTSAQYQTLCERVGRLTAEFGNRLNTDLPAAIRLSGSKLRMMGPMVSHALKRLEFRALANAELLEALCVITRDDPELAAFYQIFCGLQSLEAQQDHPG